jgi:hypothetical protein
MKTLNGYTKNNYTVNLIKLDKAILGGFYCVELSHDDEIIKEIDGLCLDAANEVFLKTVNQLNN